jgi:hypothetical protein
VAGENGVKSLPAKVIEVLSDGSCLVRLRESASMLSRRRGLAGDKSLSGLPDTIARLVEFDLLVTDRSGRARASRFWILTTVLDQHAYSAGQIAAVYAERWQVELVYYRIKHTLRGSDVVLRGRTAQLARQKISGFLVVYNALCDLATRTAVSLDIDPDEISFVAVLRLTRTRLGGTLGCRSCGTPPGGHGAAVQELIAAIAAPPQPNRQAPHQSTYRQSTTNRTNPGRQLHHRHRAVKSTQSSMKILN